MRPSDPQSLETSVRMRQHTGKLAALLKMFSHLFYSVLTSRSVVQ